MKLKTLDNTYTRWYSENEKKEYFFCINELIDIGIPIDGNGEEMKLVDGFAYVFDSDSKKYRPIPDSIVFID